LKADDWEDYRKTPLHFAAARVDSDMCQLLVSKGANIDALDDESRTPLHYDAKLNKLDICQLLVSEGAHIDAFDGNSYTLLHWAVRKWRLFVAKYLLEKGANCNLKTNNRKHRGQTLLHFAAAQGKLKMCQILVSNRANINALDENGFRPLHYVLSKKNFQVAEYLLIKKAIYHPKKTMNEYRLLLKDLTKKYSIEKVATMKLCPMLYNLAINKSISLNSICRNIIVNYTCQAKLSYNIEWFDIPKCLKSYLAFEEELQPFF
jgi:ankyrin repeat protein